MSAKIINFPGNWKSTAKSDFKKASTVEREPRRENLPAPIKIHIKKRADKEMFPPDYFMLVE